MNSHQFAELFLRLANPGDVDVVIKDTRLFMGDIQLSPSLNAIEMTYEYQRFTGWLSILQDMLTRDAEHLKTQIKIGW